MMEAVSTFETLVSFYDTAWSNIPGDSPLHTCCCENLKTLNSFRSAINDHQRGMQTVYTF
jgi:hypothetical protein